MKHRIHGLLAGAMGLASAAFFALSGASCSQPAIQCVAGHGPFYAKYELVGGDAACLGLDGEEIGLSTFLAPNADGSLADYSKRTIAIQSTTMGDLVRDREGAGFTLSEREDKAYAYGDYTTDPDANNICYAGGANGTAALAAADVNIPEFDTGEVDDMGNPVLLPAVHLRQEWKNIKVYVTAGVPGTQAVGEMHFEDVLAGCQADYKFVALFPAVFCGAEVDTDGDGEPDSYAPDDTLCLPDPDPAVGRVFGSGINPDFETTCDPDLLYCVLTSAPLTGNP